MPNWNDLVNEMQAAGSVYDVVRRKYLNRLADLTQRNVIVYYSGWLQKQQISAIHPMAYAVSDDDKTGFMSAVHKLDRTKGLDLILHTPGGETAATESLVDYLRSMFASDIRAIVPQLAMSAGTMIALACKEIVMGRHSSLGPIDPQIAGMAAHGVIEEFNRAYTEITTIPNTAPIWQVILSKYSPTLVGECDKAIKWSNAITKDWMVTGMFAGDPNADTKADAVIAELADHALTLSHARHISATRARTLGIKIIDLEDDNDLQDAVLSVHHACMQTLSATAAVKIIENHNGTAYIRGAAIPGVV